MANWSLKKPAALVRARFGTMETLIQQIREREDLYGRARILDIYIPSTMARRKSLSDEATHCWKVNHRFIEERIAHG